MHIRAQLLEAHSRQNAERIANYACESKANFKALMSCFLDPEYRVAQRAAWSVNLAARQKPELIKPFIPVLVQQLHRKDVHMAVIRNSVRVLEAAEIPEDLHGAVMNTCFSFVEDPAIPAAIKAFSLTTLYRLSMIYPEIKQELKLLINERWATETAAFRARGKKILAAIEAAV